MSSISPKKFPSLTMSKKPSFGKKTLSNGLSAIPDNIELSYSEIPLYPECNLHPVFPAPTQDELETLAILKRFESDLAKSSWYIAPQSAPKRSWEIRYADRYNPVITRKQIDQSLLPAYYPSELNIKTATVRRKKIKRDFNENFIDDIVLSEDEEKEEEEEEVMEEMEEDEGEEEGDYQGDFHLLKIVDYYADDLDMVGGESGDDE